MEMNEVGLDNGLNTFEKNILKTKYHTESKYDFIGKYFIETIKKWNEK